MTVTEHEISQGARRIVVRDEYGPLEFVGETVADLSWTYDEAYERGYTRWTDMTLYRVHQAESGTKYVLHVVGRSVLYHAPNGKCRKGVGTQVGLLRRDAKRYEHLAPCEEKGCMPADVDDLAESDIVSVEEDLHTLHRFASAAEVAEFVYSRTSRDGRSGLNMKLLQAASHVDKDIAQAMMQMRRL